ncbi:MAG: hypothetical protein FIB06_13575 [Betaproteobacteria bacterium]|nr:hypothetical protein [Betaproteobacteria bacterium]
MSAAQRNVFNHHFSPVTATHTVVGSPRRAEAESFIHDIFARHYGADISSFAPNLTLLEQHGRVIAAAGWRPASSEALFLERYLDVPVEQAVARLAGQPVQRERIVEVGNLAAEKPGATIHLVRTLALHLHRLGYEWVVSTVTHELASIFARLGLPPLALAPADPARLGASAAAWGSYYDTAPVVVAGRIRQAIERSGRA